MKNRTQKQNSKISSKTYNNKYALVLDAGTTGVKAFVFDSEYKIVSRAYSRLHKSFPHKGWVEQNPIEILNACKQVLREAVDFPGINTDDLIGLGITNQRETTVLWDKTNGKPVYPAIVWEDKRTKNLCTKMVGKWGKLIANKTGLSLDSYFSATKIKWVLNHSISAKTLADEKRLAFGTIDSWLIWNLCNENPHVTDESNASRTLLFNIIKREWDNQLLNLFKIPTGVLPKVLSSQSLFGVLNNKIIGTPLPIIAVCGDQQSSMHAAMCTDTKHKIVTKITFGTGTFIMQTIGKRFKKIQPFFTTLVPDREGFQFVLEAKIEGSAKKIEKHLDNQSTLRKQLHVLARKTDRLIKRLPNKPKTIIIDGGITRDGLMKQILEKITQIQIVQQEPFEGTALGIAHLILNNNRKKD